MELTVDNAQAYLLEVVRLYLWPGLAQFCEHEVLSNDAFLHAPGAQRNHHNYPRGLLLHTAEVVQKCLAMRGSDSINLQVLITAAIFHDFCKTKEYVVAGSAELNITTTDYKLLIGHVVGSAMHFQTRFTAQLLSGATAPELAEGLQFVEHVTHCILSHHGRLDWGSPVEPQTYEAWILHSADMLSAKGGPLLPRQA